MKWAGAGCAAVALLFSGGCASDPRLGAAWYLVPQADIGGADSQTGVSHVPDVLPAYEPTSGSPDRVVVALLNHDLSDAAIYDVFLDARQQDRLFATDNGTPRTLAPGQILLLLQAGANSASAAKDVCSVPVRLYVRTRPKQRRLQIVEIAESMPSALPSALLNNPKCRSASVADDAARR